MKHEIQKAAKTMGSLPVFMTAVSTILGAILFLRFGYAVGHTGLFGALLIIIIGHLVTVPTALAVAEIATNQKVEGGGAYYMISRSFGLKIGAAIGIALFLSQAISVAFYIIAFVVAVEPLRDMLFDQYGLYLNNRVLGLATMGLLTLLMLTKGANVGVKALYGVVLVLFTSLGMFFAGSEFSTPNTNIFATTENSDDFFYVFTIIFPAFTGIAAGLGLSGDLKDPKVSIPKGTMWATLTGIIVYIAIAFKLFNSASLEDLGNTDVLIMEKIAIWGPIIPIGLAAAGISSALGSVMIAPRTLQALGSDRIFPSKINFWFAKGRERDNEPINSILVTCGIAFFFIAIGDIDFVAQIISMFFMVTYGAICLVSLLEHFAADPSYRPTFRSKWYFSAFGAVLCFYLMFKMNFGYAALSLAIMIGIYFWVGSLHKNKKGLVNLFKGLIFQVSRQLQVYIQSRDSVFAEDSWRPFIISISKDSFQRRSALDLVRWMSHKYGFGTYIHFVEGFLSKETYQESKRIKERLLRLIDGTESRIFLDTIISPSYTSAIAQSIQLSGVSGKGNNLMLYEFSDEEPSTLDIAISNYELLNATEFDVCILKSTLRGFGYHREIHVWISSEDYINANLMILIAYIMLGHPEWKNGFIKIFSVYPEGSYQEKRKEMLELVKDGRLPISARNIKLIPRSVENKMQAIINKNSADADLTIIGFNDQQLQKEGKNIFMGYPDLGNITFVNAYEKKAIE